MEQGVIVAWLKEPGDAIEAGETLFMVETDKATSDAPSPATGIVATLLKAEGDTVPVGTVIALLVDTAEEIAAAQAWQDAAAGLPAASPAAAPTKTGSDTAPDGAVSDGTAPADESPSASPGRVLASPRARALARETGVDLAAVHPSGSRITEKDVRAMAQPPASPAPGSAGELRKLSRTRKIIAERMTLSATTIPQVTYTLRCDATDAMALRRTLKAGPGGERTAVSLDALIVKAAARALADFPLVNSQWAEGEGIRVLPEVNIAVAVDLDDKGLVIPVIHAADTLDIRATAAELDRLVAGAKAGKLGPDDYAGGTFTITSLASLGVESFNPIVVPPQAAILGVGALVPTPVFQQDQVVKRRMLALSLTTDHRILDGAPSARFLSRIRDLLEQPAKLVE